MAQRLNITNGDGAADVIRESGVAGDILPWQDLMFEGPFPSGLDLDAASALRATYFAETYPKDVDAGETFRERNRRLRAAREYDEVVLWFEHDLLDQLQLLQLLDWFADADVGQIGLSLVCIDRHPDIEPFYGLGQLLPEQLAPLYDTRAAVGADQLRLAHNGWRAFRSPDPTALERFLNQDLSPLPFLHHALSRHLEEFPSVESGLGRTDRQLLELVAQGIDEPGALFRANMARDPVLHLGDWCTFRHVARLCGGPAPLLRCVNGAPFRYPPGDAVPMAAFRAQRVAPTETGRAVLSGGKDAASLNPFEYWLGGVHLRSGEAIWRWNAAQLRLERTAV